MKCSLALLRGQEPVRPGVARQSLIGDKIAAI